MKKATWVLKDHLKNGEIIRFTEHELKNCNAWYKRSIQKENMKTNEMKKRDVGINVGLMVGTWVVSGGIWLLWLSCIFSQQPPANSMYEMIKRGRFFSFL